MHLIQRLRRLFQRHLVELSWGGILFSLLLFVVVSWLGLWASGERALLEGGAFLYWLVITASTVGYGDLSPSTTAGKSFVALFVVPWGLGLFALVIGRVAGALTLHWKRGVLGMKQLSVEAHILVIGWNGHRTRQLLELLLRGAEEHQRRPVVLCVDQEMENPMPDAIGFARVERYNNEAEMVRAAVESADCIIIDTPSDEVTMTTALFANARNPRAHLLAYFQDDSLSALLKAHCPNIECMPSVAVEMLAKSAMDPGSSALHHELISVSEGMTQYSIEVPEGAGALSVERLFTVLKRRHDATFIGLCRGEGARLRVNPPLEMEVVPGDRLFYIARERIQALDWAAFDG